MKRGKAIYSLLYTLLATLSVISCQREFNHNEDFTTDNPYDRQPGELTILAYPLNIAGGQEIPVDLVFSFKRKQEEGCELIADPAQRDQCERTFMLSLKSILFPDPDVTLHVGTAAEYNGRTLLLYELTQEIYLTN